MSKHTPEANDEEGGPSRAHTRIQGLLFLISGSAGVLITLVLSAYLAKHGVFPQRGGIPAMILVFIPLTIALAGLMQLLTGIPVLKIINRWDDMPWWQRGIMMPLIAFSPFIYYSIGIELF